MLRSGRRDSGFNSHHPDSLVIECGMGKSLSPEGLFFRFVAAMAIGGTTLGGGQPVRSSETQQPSGPQHLYQDCERPGESLASYNENEQGGCFVKRLAKGDSLELDLLTDQEMIAVLYFREGDFEDMVTLIVFSESGEWSPAGEVAPKPGEVIEKEYNGLVVTIEGREDGYFVSYTFNPVPRRRLPTPHDPFLPRQRQA